MYEIWHK